MAASGAGAISSPSTAEVLAVDATATHATLYRTVTGGAPDWFVVLELPDADCTASMRSR